jgi:predicted nuclease of predicted toxin-antitoxin system
MPLSFLLDENIPYALIPFLERKGFTVNHVRKLGKAGIRNGEVYTLAEELHSWIITRDKDFLNYVKFASYTVEGVIVIVSEKDLTRTEIVGVMKRFFDIYEKQLTEKLHITIDNDEIDILRE